MTGARSIARLAWRRDVLGLAAAAAAAPVIGVGVAGARDDRLMANIAAFRAAEADIQASNAAPSSRNDVDTDREADAWYQAIVAVAGAAAATALGLPEKARALVIALEREVPAFIGDTVEDVGQAHDVLALSLARDVLRVLA